MSNPFFGLTPVSFPFSGITDATGSFTLKTAVRAAFWCHLKMAATVAGGGNPMWTCATAAGPIGFSQGNEAEIAPILLAPGDQVTITIANAAPNSNVSGQFLGAQGPTAADVMTYNPSVSSISANVSQSQVLLATYQVDQSQLTNSFTLIVPPGVQALAINTPGPIDRAHFNRASVIGNTTQTTYWNNTDPDVFTDPIIALIDPGIDAVYTIKFTNIAGGAGVIPYYVAGIFGPQIVQTVPAFGYTNYPGPPTRVQTPDWSVVNRQNGSGVVCRASIAPVLTRTTVLLAVTFSLVPNAGRVFNAQVWDGANGSTLLGAAILGDSSTAGGKSISVTLGPYKASIGNTMTFDIDFATAAGEQQAVTASGYFEK